jgi:hypothetical protein
LTELCTLKPDRYQRPGEPREWRGFSSSLGGTVTLREMAVFPGAACELRDGRDVFVLHQRERGYGQRNALIGFGKRNDILFIVEHPSDGGEPVLQQRDLLDEDEEEYLRVLHPRNMSGIGVPF